MRLCYQANLSEINELLPEAVACENKVLVMSNADGILTLAFPNEGFSDYTKERVEFILNRKIHWQEVPLAELEEAIPIAYGRAGSVTGCTWKFRYQCPKEWGSFSSVENDDSKRFCSTCDRHVHKCNDHSEVETHAGLGNCVYIAFGDLHGETGDTILQEFTDTAIDFSDDVEEEEKDQSDPDAK